MPLLVEREVLRAKRTFPFVPSQSPWSPSHSENLRPQRASALLQAYSQCWSSWWKSVLKSPRWPKGNCLGRWTDLGGAYWGKHMNMQEVPVCGAGVGGERSLDLGWGPRTGSSCAITSDRSPKNLRILNLNPAFQVVFRVEGWYFISLLARFITFKYLNMYFVGLHLYSCPGKCK